MAVSAFLFKLNSYTADEDTPKSKVWVEPSLTVSKSLVASGVQAIALVNGLAIPFISLKALPKAISQTRTAVSQAAVARCAAFKPVLVLSLNLLLAFCSKIL